MAAWIGACVFVLASCNDASPRPAASPALRGSGSGPCTSVEMCSLDADDALRRSDMKRALALRAHGCALGDQHSCARQGFYLHQSSRDRHAVAAAIRLWRTACRADVALACSNLATFYIDGEGVLKDDARSNQLYEKACRLADGFSCGMLAISYHRGRAVARNPGRAVTLADKGCSLGSASACTVLGLSFLEGWEGARDPARATELFRRACEMNDGAGCLQLSHLAADSAETDRLRAKACDRGIEEACSRSP